MTSNSNLSASNGWDELDELSHSVRDAILSTTMPEPEPLEYKPLFSFMQSAKTKLYNMYKNYPREAATFSSSPIWLLGVRYDPTVEPPPRTMSTNINSNSTRRRRRLSTSCPSVPLPSNSPLHNDAATPSRPTASIDESSSPRDSSDAIPPAAAPAAPVSAAASTLADGEEDNAVLGLGPSTPIVYAIEHPIPGVSYETSHPNLNPFVVDFFSRTWLTYRSNFQRFEGAELTTDMGWGCMIRSAQMMLAQALTMHLLGRDWNLRNDLQRGIHGEILRWFLDSPGPRHPYSIHNIIRLATKFNKKAGEWFEPSTVSLVLKYLVRNHNTGSPPMTIYVAKEPTIYKDSVYALSFSREAYIHSPRLALTPVAVPFEDQEDAPVRVTLSFNEDGEVLPLPRPTDLPNGASSELYVSASTAADIQGTSTNVPHSPVPRSATSPSPRPEQHERTRANSTGSTPTLPPLQLDSLPTTTTITDPTSDPTTTAATTASTTSPSTNVTSTTTTSPSADEKTPAKLASPDETPGRLDSPNKIFFRPIMIVVPLRLGLSSINMAYLQQLKAFFEMPQSLGFIGGKPNTSMYFVGYQDDELLYLDPHLVQPTVSKSQLDASASSYHCKVPLKLPMRLLDPSLAVGFFCKDAHAFEDLCYRLQTVDAGSEYPLVSIGHKDPYADDDSRFIPDVAEFFS